MFKGDMLAGKRILVTGGGTGLGKVMAESYLRHGATVYIWGRRGGVLQDTADELMQAHGGQVIPQPVDIRDPQAIEAAVDEIFSEAPLDGLVNNAAGNFVSRTKDLSHRGFNAIASIVFHGSFYTTLDIGKRWIELGRPGSIISILTTWVWTGSPFVVPSSMSKAGLNSMTQSLAVEWGPHGIRLNAIAPGPFPTEGAWARLNPGTEGREDDQLDPTANPMMRVGKMSELANLALFLMSDGCDYLTGQTIAIDGAQHLANSGSFWRMVSLSDQDWEDMRNMIQQSNAADKAKRTT
ncbi:MAG: SDR family oxidoreductase [Gammaproteobacteria bacterium AqS3]|nr:SDR family oxidoreductase [Gammaproteobacteria bacterium AqS3]